MAWATDMAFDRPALDRLFRYAFTLCGDEQASFDLLQDTLQRCLEKPANALTCPEAFARRVMRNRFIDLHRRDSASPLQAAPDSDIELIAIDTHSLEDVIMSRDELEKVWEQLQPIDREILYYWAIEELSASEIAVQMGSRRGTILSRIHRLRTRLQAAFPQGQTTSEGGRG